MSSKQPSSWRRFLHNILVHGKRVVLRRERVGEAWSGVHSDVRKLRHEWDDSHRSDGEKKAQHYLDKGRKLYNSHDYTRAEEYFRSAIKHDQTCGYAYTYLGHTLYKQGRHPEAVNAWRNATVAAPGTKAAEKAAEKLRRLEGRTQKTVADLEKRIE